MNTNHNGLGTFATPMIVRPPMPAPARRAGPAQLTNKAAPKPKAAPAAKGRRTGRTWRPSSTEKLRCRYCGSDDLAPSFKRRRDRRCRACFKQRYGSAARGARSKRASKTRASV